MSVLPSKKKTFFQIFMVSGLSNDQLLACTLYFIHLYKCVFIQCLMFGVQFALLLTIHISVVAAKRAAKLNHIQN